MGASASKPPSRALLEACTTLDQHDLREVVALFRAAAVNGARAHKDPSYC